MVFMIAVKLICCNILWQKVTVSAKHVVNTELTVFDIYLMLVASMCYSNKHYHTKQPNACLGCLSYDDVMMTSS